MTADSNLQELLQSVYAFPEKTSQIEIFYLVRFLPFQPRFRYLLFKQTEKKSTKSKTAKDFS